MMWPWKKKIEKEDKSWEALHESAVALNEVKNNWPRIHAIASAANEVAADTRLRREQNHFPELLHNIMFGGKR